MSGLRWSKEQHAAWKAREAARCAQSAAAGDHISAPPSAAPAVGPLRIVLPWPPSGNTGTRHAHGAHYLTREHTDYRKRVAELVAGLRWHPVQGRLAVMATFAVPDRRRRDLDNVWKVVSDALQHAGAYPDDSAIDYLILERAPVVQGGAVNVAIQSLGD